MVPTKVMELIIENYLRPAVRSAVRIKIVIQGEKLSLQNEFCQVSRPVASTLGLMKKHDS